MKTNMRLWALGALLVVAGLALAACGGAPERTGQQPTVQVQIPESVSSRVNTPLTVRASASDVDGPGIVRVEMQVDNTVVDTVEAAEPTPTLSANLSFTPTAEGTISVMVVAIAADGVSSAPVTFVLTVVGEEAVIEEESTEDVASSVTVEAQANVEVNVYASPGIGCEVLGVWTAGDFGTLLEMTDNPDPETVWYKTNYLSEDQPGWVFYEDLTLSGDDSVLMKVSETGCPFCGDGRLNQDSEVRYHRVRGRSRM